MSLKEPIEAHLLNRSATLGKINSLCWLFNSNSSSSSGDPALIASLSYLLKSFHVWLMLLLVITIRPPKKLTSRQFIFIGVYLKIIFVHCFLHKGRSQYETFPFNEVSVLRTKKISLGWSDSSQKYFQFSVHPLSSFSQAYITCNICH